jgi:hypothetical protein
VRSWLLQLRPLLRLPALRLGALAALFVVIGEKALRLKYFVLDSDIWWHLKVGDWIIAHTAVPHTGILSRTAANLPWVAYSWGYEVMLSRAYAWFGLIGLGIFGTLLTLALACSIYWMLLRLSGRFWIAWLLTCVVSWSFLFNGTPRPFFFSIAFFAITLTLLFEANRSGRHHALYWLPALFFVWANIHIQFIYGLFLIGLFVGIKILEYAVRAFVLNSWGIGDSMLPAERVPALRSEEPLRDLGKLIAVFAACVLVTLLGPYTYHPYLVVLEYSKARFTYSVIIELQPLAFRHYSQFLELFLAAAGFFAIGCEARTRAGTNCHPANARPRIDLFKLALLAVGTIVAFRTMRDAWFICLPAAACIAEAFRAHTEAHSPDAAAEPSQPGVQGDPATTWPERLGIAAVTAICLALIANAVDFNERGLDRAISAGYPVNAINFLRRHPVPGPLYNNLNWGGFLMWYMPNDPVAIDGRNDLYGDDLDMLFFNSQNAEDSYKTDPYLDRAGVVLLDSKLPLATVLTIDPRFRLIYHDDIATVFARNSPQLSALSAQQGLSAVGTR